jgi:hypothetical protein
MKTAFNENDGLCFGKKEAFGSGTDRNKQKPPVTMGKRISGRVHAR